MRQRARSYLAAFPDRERRAFRAGLARLLKVGGCKGICCLAGGSKRRWPRPGKCCRLTAQPTPTRARASASSSVARRARVAADVEAHRWRRSSRLAKRFIRS